MRQFFTYELNHFLKAGRLMSRELGAASTFLIAAELYL